MKIVCCPSSAHPNLNNSQFYKLCLWRVFFGCWLCCIQLRVCLSNLFVYPFRCTSRLWRLDISAYSSFNGLDCLLFVFECLSSLNWVLIVISSKCTHTTKGIFFFFFFLLIVKTIQCTSHKCHKRHPHAHINASRDAYPLAGAPLACQLVHDILYIQTYVAWNNLCLPIQLARLIVNSYQKIHAQPLLSNLLIFSSCFFKWLVVVYSKFVLAMCFQHLFSNSKFGAVRYQSKFSLILFLFLLVLLTLEPRPLIFLL